MKYSEWEKQFVAKEESRFKPQNKSTVISDTIHSNEYHKIFSQVDDDKKISRKLWNTSVDMLEHRSGSNLEDIAYIDSRTGKTLVQNQCDRVREVMPTKNMRKMVMEAEPYSIISVHNHTSSSLPSRQDIVLAQKHKYKYGVVVCHNGRVFKYTVKPACDLNEADIYLERLNKLIYTQGIDVRNKIKDVLSKLSTVGLELEMFP